MSVEGKGLPPQKQEPGRVQGAGPTEAGAPRTLVGVPALKDGASPALPERAQHAGAGPSADGTIPPAEPSSTLIGDGPIPQPASSEPNTAVDVKAMSVAEADRVLAWTGFTQEEIPTVAGAESKISTPPPGPRPRPAAGVPTRIGSPAVSAMLAGDPRTTTTRGVAPPPRSPAPLTKMTPRAAPAPPPPPPTSPKGRTTLLLDGSAPPMHAKEGTELAPIVVPASGAMAPKAVTQPPPWGEGAVRVDRPMPKPAGVPEEREPFSDVEELSGSVLLPDIDGVLRPADLGADSAEELSGSMLLPDETGNLPAGGGSPPPHGGVKTAPGYAIPRPHHGKTKESAQPPPKARPEPPKSHSPSAPLRVAKPMLTKLSSRPPPPPPQQGSSRPPPPPPQLQAPTPLPPPPAASPAALPIETHTLPLSFGVTSADNLPTTPWMPSPLAQHAAAPAPLEPGVIPPPPADIAPPGMPPLEPQPEATTTPGADAFAAAEQGAAPDATEGPEAYQAPLPASRSETTDRPNLLPAGLFRAGMFGAGPRPKWFFPAVAVGGAVVGIGIVGLLVSAFRSSPSLPEVNSAATTSTARPSATARVSATAPPTASSAAVVAPPVTAPPAQVASTNACATAGSSHVIAPNAIVKSGVEAVGAGDAVALGFATDDRSGMALRLDPASLTATLTKVTAVDTIVRVTPYVTEGGLDAATDTEDRKTDPLRGRRTVAPGGAGAPFDVGVLGRNLVSVPHGGKKSTRLWTLDGMGAVEQLRGVAVGDKAYAVTFRRSGAIWIGVVSVDGDAQTAKGPLARIPGLGAQLGSPTIAASGDAVVVAWADHKGAKDPYVIRYVTFNAGDAPGEPKTFDPPSGGYGDSAMSPGAAGLAGGRFLFVWTEGSLGKHQVRALTLRADGTGLGSALTISDEGVNAGQGQAAVLADGRGVVAFLAAKGRTGEVIAVPVACGP